MAYATFTNPVGHCVSVLNPTTSPVQKPSTRRPFFATTLHDWVNLDQQSGVPRHDIPGVPVNSMAENNPRIEQKRPENNDKYFVHSAGSWSMEIADDHDAPRTPLRPKNATQNTTQTSDQKRQRTVNKGSGEYIERFSYDLEMKAREQNRNGKRTEIGRFDWFIERKDKRAWLFIG